MSTTAPENTPTKILLQTPSVNDKPHPRTKRTLACFSLEGQVAVVTGGARGLGLTIAQALATSGANVALVDLDST
jgi:short chain dehydrogenase